MDELDQRIRRMIDNQLETTIQRRLDIFVDQVVERMDALMGNENGNCYHSHGKNPNSIVISNEEKDDFSSDIEEEKYVEDEDVDVDSSSDVEKEEYEEDVDFHEIVMEIDSKPIFDMYPLENEFVCREEMVMINEPIFYTFQSEEEFVSENKETVITDKLIFDTYPTEEEFVYGDEVAIIDDEPIFDVYHLEDDFVFEDMGNEGNENKKILDEIYEQQIRKVGVQEKVLHEDLIFIEDGIILIAHVDFSMQVEKKFYAESMFMATDGKFSIHNKVSVGELWIWWESTFCIGFIRLVFDSGGTSKNSRTNFFHPGENDAVEK